MYASFEAQKTDRTGEFLLAGQTLAAQAVERATQHEQAQAALAAGHTVVEGLNLGSIYVFQNEAPQL